MEIRLKRLYIKDFNNIDELDLDMDYNIISVHGSTGSGKSSIVEAIQYLFTGSLNNRIVDYVKWNKKEFTIIGEFNIDADNFVYEVKGGKKTEKKLTINESEEYINSDATKKMEEYLDSTLMSFIISGQKKGEELLYIGGTERLQKFKKLFKLDDIMKLVEAMKEDKEEIVKEIRDNEVKLDTLTNVKYIYQNVFEIVSDIDSLNKRLSELEAELEVYNKALLDYNAYVSNKEKYDLHSVKYENIRGRVLIKEHELNEARSVGIAQEVVYNEEEHKTLIEKYNNVKLDYSKVGSNWSAYNKSQSDIEKLNKQIEDNKKLIDINVIERLPRLAFTIEDINKDIEENKVNYTTYQITKNKYEAVKNGKCPTCYAEYSSNNVEELFIAYTLFKERHESLEKSLNEKSDQLKSYQKIETENKIKQERIDNSSKNIKEYELKIEELSTSLKPEKELSAIQAELNSIFEEIDVHESNKRKYQSYLLHQKELDDKIASIQNEYNILVKEKELILNDAVVCPIEVVKPNEINSAEIDRIKKEINIYDQKVKERNNIIAFNDKIKVEEKFTNQEILKLENVLKDKKFKLTVINESITVTDKQFTAFLIDKGSEFIKNKMNQFFGKVYGRYEISYENDGKSIEFFYNGAEGVHTPISKCSGFESQLIGSAFRLAIIQLAKTNIFIADEIDSYGSDERSLNLYENILNESYLSQLIGISHTPVVQEFLSNSHNSIEYELNEGKLLN